MCGWDSHWSCLRTIHCLWGVVVWPRHRSKWGVLIQTMKSTLFWIIFLKGFFYRWFVQIDVYGRVSEGFGYWIDIWCLYIWFIFLVIQYEICLKRSVCRKRCLHLVRTGEKSWRLRLIWGQEGRQKCKSWEVWL